MDRVEPPELSARLEQSALSLGRFLLEQSRQQVVFAESCTAGLVAASLAIVPGISRSLCGSLVTYREACKTAWLGVEPQLLDSFTAVSREVTAAMAKGALQRTTEANWAAAVTGHLGPDAPPDRDGRIYIAIACRPPGLSATSGLSAKPGGSKTPGTLPDEVQLVVEHQRQLTSRSRGPRQQEAAQLVLAGLEHALRSSHESQRIS